MGSGLHSICSGFDSRHETQEKPRKNPGKTQEKPRKNPGKTQEKRKLQVRILITLNKTEKKGLAVSHPCTVAVISSADMTPDSTIVSPIQAPDYPTEYVLAPKPSANGKRVG